MSGGAVAIEYDLPSIASEFCFEGSFVAALDYGTGHINDTFKVFSMDRRVPRHYILQRINQEVFKNPGIMMNNIVRVTEHVRTRLEEAQTADIDRRVLTLIATHAGAPFHIDDAGNYWRAYKFIENSQSLDTLETDMQAYEAARAFGLFQRMLVDLPAPPLADTIPLFHDGPSRAAAFKNALEAGARGRAAEARPEIDFVLEHISFFDVLPACVAEGRIPLRTTHNDTKVNNVLLDNETGHGVCVIDLDTVMPGLSLYDFGDIVRTTISHADEDEPDLGKVDIEISRFEAVLRGYLASAGSFLNDAEVAHLPFAGQLITLMIGTRFLTDYLAGDTYFKIRRPRHNLDRARVQLKLVRRMLEEESALADISARIWDRSTVTH